MTSRDRKRAQDEQDQRSAVVAENTHRELLGRGLFVPMRELGAYSFNDCVDAQNWARNRRPTALLPPWLAELLARGRARRLPGWCRECGASASCECFGVADDKK